MLKSIATAILLAGIGLTPQPVQAQIPFSAAVRVGNVDIVVDNPSSYYYYPYNYNYGYRNYVYGYSAIPYRQTVIVAPRYVYPVYSSRVYAPAPNYYYSSYGRRHGFWRYGRY